MHGATRSATDGWFKHGYSRLRLGEDIARTSFHLVRHPYYQYV